MYDLQRPLLKSWKIRRPLRKGFIGLAIVIVGIMQSTELSLAQSTQSPSGQQWSGGVPNQVVDTTTADINTVAVPNAGATPTKMLSALPEVSPLPIGQQEIPKPKPPVTTATPKATNTPKVTPSATPTGKPSTPTPKTPSPTATPKVTNTPRVAPTATPTIQPGTRTPAPTNTPGSPTQCGLCTGTVNGWQCPAGTNPSVPWNQPPGCICCDCNCTWTDEARPDDQCGMWKANNCSATPTPIVEATPSSTPRPTSTVANTPTVQASPTHTPNTERSPTSTPQASPTDTPRAQSTATPNPSTSPTPRVSPTTTPNGSCQNNSQCGQGRVCCGATSILNPQGVCKPLTECCSSNSDCSSGDVCCGRECKSKDACCKIEPRRTSICGPDKVCCNTSTSSLPSFTQRPPHDSFACIAPNTGVFPAPGVTNNYPYSIEQCLPTCSQEHQNKWYGHSFSGSLYCCRVGCDGTADDFGLGRVASACAPDGTWESNGNGPNCLPGHEQNPDPWCGYGWGQNSDPEVKTPCPEGPGYKRSFCNGNLVEQLSLGPIVAYYNQHLRHWHKRVYDPDEGLGCRFSIMERIFSDDTRTEHHTPDRSETRFSSSDAANSELRSEDEPRGDFRVLRKEDDSFIMTDSDGVTKYFGHKIGDFYYLTKVVFSDTREINYSYTASTEAILKEIRYWDNRIVQFYPQVINGKKRHSLILDSNRLPYTIEQPDPGSPLKVVMPDGSFKNLRVETQGGMNWDLSDGLYKDYAQYSLYNYSNDWRLGNRAVKSHYIYPREGFLRNFTYTYSPDSITQRDGLKAYEYKLNFSQYRPAQPATAYVSSAVLNGVKVWSQELDYEGKLTRAVDEMGRETRFFYGSDETCTVADLGGDQPLPTCITTDQGKVTLKRDAGNGFRVTQARSFDGGGGLLSTTSTTWLKERVLSSRTDVSGQVTSSVTYNYDSSSYYPVGVTTSGQSELGFDRSRGLLTSMLSPSGALRFEYSPVGDLKLAINGANNVVINTQRSLDGSSNQTVLANGLMSQSYVGGMFSRFGNTIVSRSAASSGAASPSYLAEWGMDPRTTGRSNSSVTFGVDSGGTVVAHKETKTEPGRFSRGNFLSLDASESEG
jgi:hypothetical protein